MDENIIIQLEKENAVTATFRRLDPAKKENIFRAALEAFSREIYDRVSLEEIAVSAEISKGSLIQYFANKENILKSVITIFLNDYKNYWESYFAGEIAVRAKERIIKLFLAIMELWEKDKTSLRFYIKMRYENDATLTQEFREKISLIQREHLHKMIIRGMETGEIRRDIESEVIVQILIGVIRNLELACLTAFQTARAKTNLKDLIEKIATALFDGVKA